LPKVRFHLPDRQLSSGSDVQQSAFERLTLIASSPAGRLINPTSRTVAARGSCANALTPSGGSEDETIRERHFKLAGVPVLPSGSAGETEDGKTIR